jgi:hypothetical protein
VKVSCCILTYNEEARIQIALSHAFRWADEVVVVDKGSTDNTREIAEKAGARVAVINFSRQGHEDLSQIASFAENDWVWGFTPGEVPTKKVIDAGKAAISDDVDLIVIPHKYFSFGLHHELSPWWVSGQIRLYNRKRVRFTGVAHAPIVADRTVRIEYAEDCYVLHQTHVGAQEFMRAHADYMANEARNGTPMDAFQRAQHMIARFDPGFAANPELLPQALGWRIYWLGVMLEAWSIMNPEIKSQYQERAEAMLKEVWS